jgi:hypothetical protein
MFLSFIQGNNIELGKGSKKISRLRNVGLPYNPKIEESIDILIMDAQVYD